MRLEGKVAIVTGGAQGIGRAIADGLAAEGARIVIADLKGAEVAAARYPGGVGLTVDVASEADTATMADETVARCGRIDVLVNNAGLYATLKMRPFDEIPVDEWRLVMDVNVLSMFLATDGHVSDYGPGGAWFESGPSPVHATASAAEDSAFVRVLVLPAECEGKRTISYVDPADAEKPKLQRARVYFDRMIGQ